MSDGECLLKYKIQISPWKIVIGWETHRFLMDEPS